MGLIDPLGLLEASSRQASTLDQVDHRPWPLPDGGWAQAQTWEELLFAHWTVPAQAVRAHVPAELEVDTFQGDAYLGVTPFKVTNLRLRGLLPAPVFSSFLELNCRTYVSHRGKPGIWFFSLDASSRFAVEGARRLYKLPYFRARMSGPPAFSSVRVERSGEHAFEATYHAVGHSWQAAPGTLEHFLTERYCLYAVDEAGKLRRAEIHHPPWPLQDATADVSRNSLPPDGLEVAGEPHLLFSARQDVLIWPLRPAT
jgi:uncharacterized protein YqjF (DUF2071 family)